MSDKMKRQAKSKWQGELKECSGNGSCGQFLSVDNFNKKGRGNYRSQCKSCWNVWRRRDSKTDHGRAKQKKHEETYYKNHPEKLREKEEQSEESKERSLKKKCLRLIEKMLKAKLSQDNEANRIESIRERVKSFGYDILSEFNMTADYALVKCESGHERRARISNILRGNGGCGECRIDKGHQKLIRASEKLDGEVLTKFESKHKRVLYRCCNGHETLRYPQSIWDGHHCGDCENGGTAYSHFHGDVRKQNKDAHFYQFYFNKDDRTYKMIGIATVWKARMNQYKSEGIKMFDVSVVKMKAFEAFICEQEILHRSELQEIRAVDGLGFSGSTECFDVTDVNLFHPIHNV